MKTLMTAVLCGTFLIGSLSAESFRRGQWDDQRRIYNGERTGRLTPREASRLERQREALNRQYWRDRRDGGGLSYRERCELERRENQLDRRTSRQLRDRDRRW
ncbi:MAG: hypothetical protein H7039_22045 [Bryobacteraceae bacterium]|nr:hypothetical protein [Bryobacteraceae bacterium]